MNKDIAAHDILNLLERLRIMHDLIQRENYSTISKEEVKQDLDEALLKLNQLFKQLLQ
jgi:hypothetical protein